MTETTAAKHNRLFQHALGIIKGQIPLNGQRDQPEPGWLVTRKLKYAIILFERVLEINPKNWSAMWFIGKVHQRFRNEAEALSWFERSYQLNPSNPDISREASLSAMEIGCSDTAIVFARRAIEVHPIDGSLHANLALAYLLAGHIADADTTINRALTADPSDTIAQTIRAMVEHFAANGCVPPNTTPALLNYWRTAALANSAN